MNTTTQLMVSEEMARASKKFPAWPDDPIHAAAIVCEEAGELIRACLRMRYEGGPVADVLTEALHTAATAARFLDGK